MRKMQKIAPQTQKIRERYKKVKPTDPRYHEMNQEMQALYKEHGVNPVSGCLPMLLMIPFFFAFYRMLMASIELRQAPFVFWIQDLAVHDPYFVLPILMGGTQLAIQKMTPQTSADPVQAKIMSFMPIIVHAHPRVGAGGARALLVLEQPGLDDAAEDHQSTHWRQGRAGQSRQRRQRRRLGRVQAGEERENGEET